MLVNSLIIILTILLMDFLGFSILKKVKYLKNSYIFPIGFIAFFGLFEIFSLIPMLIHANFNYYLISLLVVTVISLIILIIKNYQDYVNNIKQRFKDKNNIIILFMAIFSGLIVGIFSFASGDSWLYSPMLLSCLENGKIFSHNGIEINGAIQSFHYTDGYYLFQAVLAKLSIGNPFVFITTYFKFLEGFILAAILYMTIDGFTKKNKIVVFIIVLFSTLLGCSLFANYVGNDEVYTHLFKSMALGISIINIGFYAIFYLIITSDIKNKYKLLLVPLFIFSAFSFTSSTLFMALTFLIVIYFLFLIRNKERFELFPLVNGFCVLLIFICVYGFNISNKIGIILIILSIISIIIIYLLINKLSLSILKKLSFILGGLYLLITFLLPIILLNSNIFVDNVLNNQTTALYYDSTHYYVGKVSNIIGLVLTIFGIIYIYKNNKTFGLYVLIFIILFANPFAYRILGEIVNQAVYHRVFNLYLPGVINLMGLSYIIYLLDNKFDLKQYKMVYAFLLPIVLYFPTHSFIFSYMKDGMLAYKLQNPEVAKVSEFDFSQTPNVVVSILPNPTPKLSGYTEDIFKVRPDLNWVDCQTKGPKYYIVPKSFEQDLPLVYQTDTINIYLDQEDTICQINKN